MHVIHLNLERGWRGGERQVFLLVRELQKHQVEQTVVGRKGEPLLERLASLRGVRLVGACGRLEAVTRMRGLPRPAVLQAHTAGALPLAVLARGPGDAVVATRRLTLPVNRFWYRRADRLVAISPAVAASLEASGLDAGRISVIPSAIDPERGLDPSWRSRLREQIGVPEVAALGLTVAALEPQKDPLALVRAFAFLPSGFHHVWVGDGSLGDEMEAAIERNGLDGRLHLAGFDPDPDRWFAAADLFVLPSLHEGLGSVILDAFHFGLPVAATRIPGVTDIVEDGVSGLLAAPGDAAGLAAAVRKIMDNPREARRLVEAGKRRLGPHFIGVTASAYLDLYREALAARGASSR